MPTHQAISGSAGRQRVFPDFSLTQTSYAAGTSLPKHSHTQPILSFALSGGTAVSIRRSTEWCDETTLLFLPAGEEHANAYPHPATRLHVELTPRFWKTALGENAACPAVPLRHPIAAEFRRAVLAAFLSSDHLAALALSLSLTDIAGLLAAPRSHARDMQASHWLLRLRDFLAANCAAPVDMQALVEVTGHHPVHVSREFRSHFGKSITEFIRERRVARAAALLDDRSLPLAEIALQCGFCDQSHFTNVFRRYTGAAPSRYRASQLSPGGRSMPFPGIPSQ